MRARYFTLLVAVYGVIVPTLCAGFTGTPISSFLTTGSRLQKDERLRTTVNLVPISRFTSDMTFLSSPDSYRCSIDDFGRLQGDNNEVYELCVAEEDDLPEVSRFVVEAFEPGVIALSSNLNNFEKVFFEPAVNILNGYSGLVAYAEVLSGLRSRMKGRMSKTDLSPPLLHGKSRQEKLTEAARTSLVLALAKRTKDSDWRINVIASVELRLQVRQSMIS